MTNIEQVIEILKGLQAIDGEYDLHREQELYTAIRLLEEEQGEGQIAQARLTKGNCIGTP